ncbi:unnamed protein product [Ectocarpus sp. CCAP 1310/34]|nr:unnamed protein product [Ectocarpus sp. CCAP 1310/34]
MFFSVDHDGQHLRVQASCVALPIWLRYRVVQWKVDGLPEKEQLVKTTATWASPQRGKPVSLLASTNYNYLAGTGGSGGRWRKIQPCNALATRRKRWTTGGSRSSNAASSWKLT